MRAMRLPPRRRSRVAEGLQVRHGSNQLHHQRLQEAFRRPRAGGRKREAPRIRGAPGVRASTAPAEPLHRAAAVVSSCKMRLGGLLPAEIVEWHGQIDQSLQPVGASMPFTVVIRRGQICVARAGARVWRLRGNVTCGGAPRCTCRALEHAGERAAGDSAAADHGSDGTVDPFGRAGPST